MKQSGGSEIKGLSGKEVLARTSAGRVNSVRQADLQLNPVIAGRNDYRDGGNVHSESLPALALSRVPRGRGLALRGGRRRRTPPGKALRGRGQKYPAATNT